MADWPVIGGGQFAEQLNPDNTDSGLTTASTIACGANDTKSAWAELIASTAESYCGLWVSVFSKGTADADNVLVDIGIGASGSEQVVLENFGMSPNYATYSSFFLPVRIPSGTRLSARGQTNHTSAVSVDVSIAGVPGDFLAQSYQIINTYGADTVDTNGTTLPPGAAAHTKGAYAEITSATTSDIKYLIIDVLWDQTATGVSRNILFDIAVGAAGSEQIVLSDFHVWQFSVETVHPGVIAIPLQIPAGSRIAGRCQQPYDSGPSIQLILHGLS